MTHDFAARLEQIEKSLNDALSFHISSEWKKKSFGTLPAAISDMHLLQLVEPCKQLIALGGKRWRPLLLVLCAESARSFYRENALLSEEATYTLAPLVEFVHTASLIHDDIEDCSDTRRGKPAAYITYGIDSALNAASWLYFEACVRIDALPIAAAAKAKFSALYTKELRRLHVGQAMDIFWHRNKSHIPSLEEYTAMVQHKTGTLASLAAQAGIIAGGGTDEEAAHAGDIAAEIGGGFQILDDVQNLTTGNPGKKRGDDIVEGKKSLPVLLHISAHPEDRERMAMLFSKAHDEGIDSPAVEECISLLAASGAVAAAYEKGCKLVQEKSSALASLYKTETASAGISPIVKLFSAMMEKQKNAFTQEMCHA
ncbi:MAG: polyprenyl synthetase family protein [Treponema sp.]|nr:polyprenyl synthetase family protein [Treponema sp.]